MYKVVVGVDASAGSAAAIAWCAQVTPLLSPEVIAVHALTSEESLPSDAEFDDWCAPAADPGGVWQRIWASSPLWVIPC